jgi:hypothetical protein
MLMAVRKHTVDLLNQKQITEYLVSNHVDSLEMLPLDLQYYDYLHYTTYVIYVLHVISLHSLSG